MKHIKVKVLPDSKKDFVEKLNEDKYKVYIREPAKDNRANKALLKIMAEEIEVEQRKLRIISGHKYLNKILCVFPYS